MTNPELARLELLAEMDSLDDSLRRWSEAAPDWPQARTAQALLRRLAERTEPMRIRLEAPLVVATLGGTGTGKSALVNALVGEEVTQAGRSRPTTLRPRLISRPDVKPESLGIDPASVEHIVCDSPGLADLILIDCPDPDTSESSDTSGSAGSNLARLRRLLPFCDVLLITATQQKYRSARVADELGAAGSGARLVFVQTHADEDEDIREDWRGALDDRYAPGEIFLVDSLAALSDAQDGLAPRGEFARLRDLLTRQLAGTAAVRIRRANHLDLVADTLAICGERVDQAMPTIARVEETIEQQRIQLSVRLAEKMRAELVASRRPWENRLVGKVASLWGFSPFALVLRVFQGLGGLVASSLLFRARSPAQVALWGAVQGARSLQKRRRRNQADQAAGRAIRGCWNQGELHESALVLEGYAAEAQLDRESAALSTVSVEAEMAGSAFVDQAAGELESLLDRVARRHTGWFTRVRYEILTTAMLGVLLARLAKNFFYDSWLAESPQAVYGLDVYLLSAFWLIAWCGLLLWGFTSRLRRGLNREISTLADAWKGPKPAEGIFARLQADCRRIRRFRHDLGQIQQHVAALRRRLDVPDQRLGHRRKG